MKSYALKSFLIMAMSTMIFGYYSCSSKAGGLGPNSMLKPDTLSTLTNDETVITGKCREKRQDMLQLSDAEIFDLAVNLDLGNCRISDASDCTTCACEAYVKVDTATWPQLGWALNPGSLDSTGCVSTTCYPGYTTGMCTPDLTVNSLEQIKDALRHPEDVCGLCDSNRPITPEMVLN